MKDQATTRSQKIRNREAMPRHRIDAANPKFITFFFSRVLLGFSSTPWDAFVSPPPPWTLSSASLGPWIRGPFRLALGPFRLTPGTLSSTPLFRLPPGTLSFTPWDPFVYPLGPFRLPPGEPFVCPLGPFRPPPAALSSTPWDLLAPFPTRLSRLKVTQR